MTGVRWTRAEAEQAVAAALNECRLPYGRDTVPAVLDALGITETCTVVAGHLEQVDTDATFARLRAETAERAADTDCCGNDAWRGRFCPYHLGFIDGLDKALTSDEPGYRAVSS